jgi:dolichyl-diphosphooligosaccharide--protein glycosyltransferase
MRLVDYMTANFPHLPAIDSYLAFPDGEPVGAYYFFARLIGGVSWLFGLGNPSVHLIDMVGIFIPPIMGALLVIPVYFIGRLLTNKYVGLISAALVAFLPGELLGRSILGFTDHHIAEVLFSAIAIMFLIFAIKSKQVKKLYIYSGLSGLFLGIYMLTWIGGLLVYLTVFVCVAVLIIMNHLRKQPIKYLVSIGMIILGISSLMFLPTTGYGFFYILLIGSVLSILVLWLLSKYVGKSKYYLLSIMGLLVLGFGLFYLTNPLVIKTMWNVLIPSSTQLTTIEMQSILFPQGQFTFSIVWGNFGLSIFIGLIGLGILIYNAFKHKDSVAMVIVIWSLVILIMTLGQRRFAYYLSVNVAILTGYFCWLVLKWAGLSGQKEIVRRRKKNRELLVQGANISVVVVILGLFIFGTIMPSTVSGASSAPYAPSDSWCESLDWLEDNSPNESNYGVLSWWDYGYWITRIAHRIPYVNPSQYQDKQEEVAKFLMGDNSTLTPEYVVIDNQMVFGKYWAINLYAGKSISDYCGLYYVSDGNQIKGVQLFYPVYYQSLEVQLFNFDGKEYIPEVMFAIKSEVRNDRNGNAFNYITDAKQFTNYEDFDKFVTDNDGYMIVGNNPFKSPVYLGAVNDYELVYGSSQKTDNVSDVKIFRRIN